MDFLFGLLNLVAYILMAIELNQASADENQGKSPMQMSSESFKFGYGMAIAFIIVVFIVILPQSEVIYTYNRSQ